MDLSKLSLAELEALRAEVEKFTDFKRGMNNLENLLQNSDFLEQFISSEAFNGYCSSMGYDIHTDDRVCIVLPLYLDLFAKGGVK